MSHSLRHKLALGDSFMTSEASMPGTCIRNIGEKSVKGFNWLTQSSTVNWKRWSIMVQHWHLHQQSFLNPNSEPPRILNTFNHYKTSWCYLAGRREVTQKAISIERITSQLLITASLYLCQQVLIFLPQGPKSICTTGHYCHQVY